MTQSKKMSFIESWANVIFGYLVAVGSQIIIFPWFGIHIPVGANFLMGLWFTAVSLGRSYIVRRIFNKYQEQLQRIYDRIKSYLLRRFN
jgi:hypothetical protein